MDNIINLIEKITKIITNVFLLVLLFLIVKLIVNNSFQDKLIINELNINSKLVNYGYNSKIISSKLISEIERIRNLGNSSFKKEFDKSNKDFII